MSDIAEILVDHEGISLDAPEARELTRQIKVALEHSYPAPWADDGQAGARVTPCRHVSRPGTGPRKPDRQLPGGGSPVG
jgi:hypothetical protein